MSDFLDEHFVVIPVGFGGKAKAAPLFRSTATCAECGRKFDLTDEADADEFYNGHDCEA